MASLAHVLQLIVEGEKDPSEIREDFWKDLRDYVERLEEESQEVESVRQDEEREVQEETPIKFNFGGVQEEFDTTEDIVETLMRNKDKARNDFQFIEWYIKTQIQNLDLNTFEGYKKGIKNSTIQRGRRKVVEDNPDLAPDEEIQEEKERKEEQVRQKYSKSTAQREEGVTKVS